MKYLTYEAYVTFGSSLEAPAFDRLEYRAEREIDLRTQSRLASFTEIPEAVQMCMFELIEYLSANLENGSVRVKSSESNDGYSVSYSEVKNADREIYDIIYTYLSDTGLMFCGVDGGLQ